jgi:hypothetical protein
MAWPPSTSGEAIMNKAIALLPLGLLSFACHSAVLGVADMQDGASIVFHDESGPCKGAAKLASFITPKGESIPGCWVSRAQHIAVVFFDGDVGAVPVAALKPPKNV